MRLIVSPIWPWPLVALAIFALLAVVLLTYPARVRHLSPAMRRLLLALRLAAAIVLALTMLRPAVQHRETDRKQHVLLVGIDKSRSFATEDGPGGVSRRAAALKILADSSSQFARLGKEIDIRTFDFAERPVVVEKPEATADGQQSAIGATLEALAGEARNSRILGLLLLTDGAQRALPGFDADPRTVARLLGQQQIPVYSIGFGGTGVTGNTADLAIEDLQVDPIVFQRKTMPVTGNIRAVGAAGREILVQLLVEDRSGKNFGEAGTMKLPQGQPGNITAVRLKVRGNDELIPVEFTYTPELSGEVKLGVRIEPAEGELRLTNNERSTIVTVREGGINIAYFDRLRPEQKFVRMVNTSDKIQLDFVAVRSGVFRGETSFPPDAFERGRYNAYIIGDVPASTFTPQQLKSLAERVNEGAGLLMTGGYESFGPGGYANTPLADVLPVLMSPTEIRAGNEIAPDLHLLQPLPMLPTKAGLSHFIMRIDTPDKNAARWTSLAPLEGANRLRLKEGLVEVLAATSSDYPASGIPLLSAHRYGGGRVMAFAGDTTYQWVLGGDREAHQRFWRQVVLWLCRMEEQSDQPVWARVDPRNFAPNQRVEIEFGAQTEDGDPIADAQFDVEVFSPPAAAAPLVVPDVARPVPRRSGDRNRAEYSEGGNAGDYWVRVTARREGNVYGFPATTRFIVDDRDLEMDNPAADHALLKEIAQASGGRYLQPEELPELLNQWLTGGNLNTQVTKESRISLWDNWYFLLVFVSLMSAEWFLRKRKGLV